MAFFFSGYGSRLSALNGYFKHILYEVCLNAPESTKFALTAMGLSPTLAPVPTASGRQYGEVSEWLKEHAWKVCIRQRIEGSNPSLTAIFKREPVRKYRLFCVYIASAQGGMRTLDQGSTGGLPPGRQVRLRACRPKGEAQRAESIPPSPPYLKKEPVRKCGLFCVYIASPQGGMRTLDQGSTGGLPPGRQVRLRACRPKGEAQRAESIPPHRHIQRKSLS